jgi:hypothetical protein
METYSESVVPYCHFRCSTHGSLNVYTVIYFCPNRRMTIKICVHRLAVRLYENCLKRAKGYTSYHILIINGGHITKMKCGGHVARMG